MNNDLISRSELKKEVENLVVGGAEGLKNYYENGSKSDENSWIGGIYDAWELINNAQTALFPLTVKINGNVTDEDIETLKRLMTDYNPQVLNLELERSQSDLADEVWKLYEKHQSHLAIHVLEFGDELKELLGKYKEGGADND